MTHGINALIHRCARIIVHVDMQYLVVQLNTSSDDRHVGGQLLC